MNIIIVGLNHKTAPVEIREKLSFPSDTIGEALRDLLDNYEISEGAIISTCNRVEVIGVSAQVDKGIWEIKRFLSSYHNIPLEDLDENLYVHVAEKGVQHLFRVAASLDSMVMGEPQILGQVKDAFSYAVHHKSAGLVLRKLFHKTFTVAKKIRTETNIGSSAVSISFAAVELAKKIFGDLSDKNAMLIGAGEMAELAAKHLVNSGANSITVANRTFEKAQELAREFEGRAIKFEHYLDHLKDVDIIIASTGAQHYIIKEEDIKKVLKERKQKPMFFIDISVPRNIDPLVNNIDNVYLYDVDSLQGVVSANLKERNREAEKAEKIIVEELPKFYRWVKSLDVVPTIIGLQKMAEGIRKSEIQKSMKNLGELTDKQEKTLDALTKAIVKKILHHPVTHLKKESNNIDGDLYIEAVRKLFDLEQSEIKEAMQEIAKEMDEEA